MVGGGGKGMFCRRERGEFGDSGKEEYVHWRASTGVEVRLG